MEPTIAAKRSAMGIPTGRLAVWWVLASEIVIIPRGIHAYSKPAAYEFEERPPNWESALVWIDRTVRAPQTWFRYDVRTHTVVRYTQKQNPKKVFFHISRQIDVLDEAKEVYRGEDGSQLTKVCSWTERALDGFSVGGGR